MSMTWRNWSGVSRVAGTAEPVEQGHGAVSLVGRPRSLDGIDHTATRGAAPRERWLATLCEAARTGVGVLRPAQRVAERSPERGEQHDRHAEHGPDGPEVA